MKQFVIIIIVWTYSLVSSAQVSGYMGKKIALEYGFNTGLQSLTNYIHPEIKKKHMFSAGFTISQKTVVQASYGFSDYTLGKRTELFYQGHLFTHANAQGADLTESEYVYPARFIEVSLKRFIIKSIAPIGAYVKFGMSNIQWSNKKGEYQMQSSTETYTFKDNVEYSCNAVVIGFGRTGIIAGPVYMNGGMDFGLPLGVPSARSDLAKIANKKVKNATWYHFRIGIGLLLI